MASKSVGEPFGVSPHTIITDMTDAWKEDSLTYVDLTMIKQEETTPESGHSVINESSTSNSSHVELKHVEKHGNLVNGHSTIKQETMSSDDQIQEADTGNSERNIEFKITENVDIKDELEETDSEVNAMLEKDVQNDNSDNTDNNEVDIKNEIEETDSEVNTTLENDVQNNNNEPTDRIQSKCDVATNTSDNSSNCGESSYVINTDECKIENEYDDFVLESDRSHSNYYLTESHTSDNIHDDQSDQDNSDHGQSDHNHSDHEQHELEVNESEEPVDISYIGSINVHDLTDNSDFLQLILNSNCDIDNQIKLLNNSDHCDIDQQIKELNTTSNDNPPMIIHTRSGDMELLTAPQFPASSHLPPIHGFPQIVDYGTTIKSEVSDDEGSDVVVCGGEERQIFITDDNAMMNGVETGDNETPNDHRSSETPPNINSHNNTQQCPICGYTPRQPINLNKHMQQHNSPDDVLKSTICITCGVTPCACKSRHRERKGSTGNNNFLRTFICHICDYAFTQKGQLNRHIVKVHVHQKTYKCIDCNLAFLYNHQLKKHMRTHTGEKRFTCVDCNREYTSKVSLLQHQLPFCRRKTHYKCDKCAFTCTTLSGVKNHRWKHVKEKPHTCSLCTFKCMRPGDLTRHMTRHFAKKKYQCTKCEFGTTQKYVMALHKKSHMYKCSDCRFQCDSVDELKAHIPKHTRAKSYTCSLCLNNYKSQRKLDEHAVTHVEDMCEQYNAGCLTAYSFYYGHDSDELGS